MTYTERLRNAAKLIHDQEIQFLILNAADRLEQLNMWKLKWAESDHAYSELQGRYMELKEQFETYRKNHP